MTHRWRLSAALALLLPLLAAGCAARAGDTGAAPSEDERITAEVMRILADEEDIVAADLEVETRAGVVVLTGVQEEPEAVRELLQRVARVRGVSEVVNRIRIVRGEVGG